MFIWVKRLCLGSLFIFVVGTIAFGIALPFMTRGLSGSAASEGAMGFLLFTPFLFLALIFGLLLLVLTIWDGVRQLF